jgi:hypothetical protein
MQAKVRYKIVLLTRAPSCNTPRITGLTTWIFSGRMKADPLKCTDPTVGGFIKGKESEMTEYQKLRVSIVNDRQQYAQSNTRAHNLLKVRE